jgi:hypothetical protein
MATAKTVNYTPEMEAAIRAAAPITFDSAAVLAEKLGKPARSIIAKAKSLGVEYIAKPAPAKRVTGGASKAEVVASISAKLGGVDLSGLDKATSAALAALDGAIQ